MIMCQKDSGKKQAKLNMLLPEKECFLKKKNSSGKKRCENMNNKEEVQNVEWGENG